MNCGIVILNYKDSDTTRSLLDAIKDYKELDRIVVVDNASPDDSYDRLKPYENEKITILKAEANNGYAAGNNVGVRYLLKQSDCDLICISNPDVEFSDEYVGAIKKCFAEHLEYAALTGVQRQPSGEPAARPFWPCYTVKEWLKKKAHDLRVPYHILHPRYDQEYAEEKLRKNSSLFQVGTVEGSMFFIRASVLESVGLFDEGTFLYLEEDILAKKLERIGLKTGVEPGISYIHYGSQTTQKVLPSRKKMDIAYNSSIYYFNNYQTDNKALQLLHKLICITNRREEIIVTAIKRRLNK